MELTQLRGKRSNSIVYYVTELHQVYIKVNELGQKVYLKCFYENCGSRGFIKENNLFLSEETKPHSDHDCSVDCSLKYFKFFEDLERESTSSKENPKKIFDNVYGRLEI